MKNFEKFKKMMVATVISLSIVALFGAVNVAFTAPQPPCDKFGDTLGVGCASVPGLGSTDIRQTIANVIGIALTLVGTVVVVIIIWAGFRWMTAGGNEEQVGMAKKQLGQAVIGLAIILMAYSITQFVTTSLLKATT